MSRAFPQWLMTAGSFSRLSTLDIGMRYLPHPVVALFATTLSDEIHCSVFYLK
jgi:hypothetical protein